jgi:hypothetical protein
MESKTIKILVLLNQQLLISEIEEVGADIGEPDCKLINPYVIRDQQCLEPFMMDYTMQTVFMMSSEKILTLVDPTKTLYDKYISLTKG